MNKLKFDNMELNINDVKSIDETFDEIYGDNMFYVSKEEFTHEEEGLFFKYKYVIEVLDMQEYTGEKGGVITLELVVSPEYIHENIYTNILESMGLEDTEYKLEHIDIKQYGFGVLMNTEEYRVLNNKKVAVKLDTLASLVFMVDSFRGFNLDKAWNRVGTTGWDTIRHLMFNENLFGF